MKHRQIKLKPPSFFLERGVEIPSFVWRSGQFPFRPPDFAPNDERLNPKVFSGAVQVQSLERFESDPTAPAVYGVAAEPNDGPALYFAAYLVQTYLERVPGHKTVKWERIYANFKNQMLDNEEQASLLVLSNLTPNSTAAKLEKTRDMLEYYSNIPRIVVIAGEDPITFFSRRLYWRVNNLFFVSSSLVKRKVEVV